MRDVLVTCGFVASGIAAAELAARLLRLDGFAARKLLHVVASVVVVASTAVADHRAYVWTGAIFTVVMAASRLLPLAALARTRQGSLGEVFFPAGVAAAAAIASEARAFVVAILILGLADTAAALAGRLRSPDGQRKTLAGSAAFLATAGVLGALAAPWPRGLLVAAVATAVEALSPKGSDNLTVPVVAALCLAWV